jgi:signal transduction histidine kinase
MRKQRNTAQYAYLVILALLGAGSAIAIFFCASETGFPNALLLGAIGIAYIVSDYYGVTIETATPGSFYEMTVTDASVVFGLIVAGPWSLLPILIGSLAVRYLQRQWEQPLGYMFNITHRATGCCLWLALYIATQKLGSILPFGLFSLGQLIILMASYLLWDFFFYSLLISMGSKQPAIDVFRQKLSPTVWIDSIPIIMGVLAALIFTFDPWFVLLAIMPLYLAYRAMIAVVQRLELTTALQRANEQLAQANERLELRVAERTSKLEQALRAKDDFVSVVTHELRTPLTSIVGSLGMLVDILPQTVSSRTHRMVAIAHKNSEQLNRLVNDILDIQKFTTHTMSFTIRPIDITALIDQAIEMNRMYAKDFDIQLVVQHCAHGWFVLGDADRLIQVLTNLLSNACKFSPVGGQVIVSAEARERMVRVAVIDHGPGIPEFFRDLVFEKFTQADTSTIRRHRGSGLGLHIAKSIIDALGGTIGFTTESGVGTTFYFELSGTPAHVLQQDVIATTSRMHVRDP